MSLRRSGQRDRQYLREKLGWTRVELLGGVEHPNKPKPSWMFYYDAGDTTSPVNEVAEMIAGLLPDYERMKTQGPDSGRYRGVCVLVYSPMECAGAMTSPQNQKWSLGEMRKEVLEWHLTPAARKQYRSRPFG